MLQFLQNNAGTLIIGAVVFVIVAIIIARMIASKRRGAGAGCGCSGCDGCATRNACNSETKTAD